MIKQINQELKQLSPSTKVVLLIGVILVAYGFISRIVGIYFFWESQILGWYILLIGAFLYLRRRVQRPKTVKPGKSWEKTGMGVVLLSLVMQVGIMVSFTQSRAYQQAAAYLRKDAGIQQELGTVTSIGWDPSGSMHQTIGADGESGDAVLTLTVKGTKAYKDVTVFLTKEADKADWQVEQVL